MFAPPFASSEALANNNPEEETADAVTLPLIRAKAFACKSKDDRVCGVLSSGLPAAANK